MRAHSPNPIMAFRLFAKWFQFTLTFRLDQIEQTFALEWWYRWQRQSPIMHNRSIRIVSYTWIRSSIPVHSHSILSEITKYRIHASHGQWYEHIRVMTQMIQRRSCTIESIIYSIANDCRSTANLPMQIIDRFDRYRIYDKI